MDTGLTVSIIYKGSRLKELAGELAGRLEKSGYACREFSIENMQGNMPGADLMILIDEGGDFREGKEPEEWKKAGPFLAGKRVVCLRQGSSLFGGKKLLRFIGWVERCGGFVLDFDFLKGETMPEDMAARVSRLFQQEQAS